ncbi:MAG: TROVE domain-containing protein [Acidobacteria bacterium]|nr:TROVE domain-containing protein [Acidobacteriota bacterium]
MLNYLTQVIAGPTPQSEPLFGRGSEMVLNSAGGFVFPVDDWKRMERFLILGAEGGSYYASERKLALENAEATLRAIEADGLRAIRLIVKVSDGGRAPKNDPALFALALAASAGDDRTKRAAFRALPIVARTGTHLFRFAEYVDSMRGWGRGLRSAVADWYLSRSVSERAYQMAKYRQREGWSHRDLLRLAHPKAEGARDALFGWATQGRLDAAVWPELRLLEGYEKARTAATAREAATLIRDYELTREMIPTQFLQSPEVWEALFDRMPLTALIRNLATLTRVGLMAPLSATARAAAERLGDAEALRKARVHPIAVLAALRTYAAGKGVRGSGEWAPVPTVVDALDRAFYRAFENAPATGKRFYLALDVSGSMGYGEIAGVPGLTPRVAAAAMAMTIARTEPQYTFGAFAHEMQRLSIRATDSLEQALETTDGLPFGATDASLPMLAALEQGLQVDAFVVLTDSETWFGRMHPVEALRRYRDKTGIPAKLVVVAMVSNGFTIADPNDAGMLDVVGFDTATPQVMADFAAE